MTWATGGELYWGWGLQERLNFKIKLKILLTGGLSFIWGKKVIKMFLFLLYDIVIDDGLWPKLVQMLPVLTLSKS